MKYLFIDIECADGGKGTICTFGYVLTDMNFKIIRRDDLIMNPESQFNLEGRAGRPDVPLAYPRERFLMAPKFPRFYEKIKALVENEEYYVVGHAVNGDASFLNKSCRRYKLPPMKFRYFDTQRMFMELFGEKRQISLENALYALGVEERFRSHQSIEDARATSLLLKALLEKAGVSFEEYMASTDRCTGATVDGNCTWDYIPPAKIVERESNNSMRRGKRNHDLFLEYLNFGEGIGERSGKLQGKKVSISMNYESEHFKEMLVLAGMIKAAGGEYVIKATNADIFASVDYKDEDGNCITCSRLNYVKAEIESGATIELINFGDLLALLGTTEEELEAITEEEALELTHLIQEDKQEALV